MKSILLFVFASLFGSLFSQTTTSGDWKLIKDEYTNYKTITVPAFKEGSEVARVIIKVVEDTYYWNLYDDNENYLYLSREEIQRTSLITVYVKINGANKEFKSFYGNPMILTSDLVEAFKTGTEAAIKFSGNPNYFKFSLNGISKAIEWLVQP